MDLQNAKDIGNKYIMHTYDRLDVVIERGEGAKVYDQEGREYDDFLSGIAVCNLGYSNEKVNRTLHEQADKIIHTSNYYWVESQIKLAEFLAEHACTDQVFFASTGTEANEAAVKLARRYQYDRGMENKRCIIAMEDSFHGRSLTALTITDNDDYKEGFGDLPDDFGFIDLNDLSQIEKIDDCTCAVIVEPVQGEGGLYIAEPEFLQALRKRCDETGAVLIFDEIQCGVSRTGSLFAYEQTGVEPDIITMAKGMGNGIPIGAVLAKKEIAESFQLGVHGTTFGGNPLSTAVALATLEEHIRLDIPGRTKEVGAYFKEQLEKIVNHFESCIEVRGKGLMLGIELTFKARPVVDKMVERGFILNSTAENVLRFVPPLIIEKEAIDRMIESLREVLKECES